MHMQLDDDRIGIGYMGDESGLVGRRNQLNMEYSVIKVLSLAIKSMVKLFYME